MKVYTHDMYKKAYAEYRRANRQMKNLQKLINERITNDENSDAMTEDEMTQLIAIKKEVDALRRFQLGMKHNIGKVILW